MNFKTNLLIPACLFGMLSVTSCDNKSEAEKQRLDEQVEMEIDSIQMAKAEWDAYNSRIQSRIAENELRIQEIQDKLKGNGGVIDKARQSRIDALRAKNDELKAKLSNWSSDYSKWEEFKADVDKSVDELDASVRDFFNE